MGDLDNSYIDIEGGQDDINQSTLYNLDTLGSGDQIEFPSEFCRTETEVQDQRKCKYPNGCSCYAGSHVTNIIAKFMKTTGNDLWINAVENETGNPKVGRAMSLAIAMFKRLDLWEGYANIAKDNTYLIKKRLYEVGPIFTGSNKIDRVAMAKAKTKLAIIKSGPGHFFTLVGWSDTRRVWIMRDSFGMLRGDGHFEVSYDDISSLFTLIAVITKEERELLKANKDEIAKQKAIYSGVTNGLELDKEATRGQVAVMLGRLKYGNLSIIELLQKTKQDKIWNGVGDSQPILREDMFTMVARYLNTDLQGLVQKGLTNLSRRENYATREEISILIGRILLSKYTKNS